MRFRGGACLSVLNAESVVVTRDRPVGTHHPHGVLLGRGPGVRRGATAGLMNILDVAPLLLHSLGLEIPLEYEGTFPNRLYDPGYLRSDPPRIGQEAGEPVVAAGPEHGTVVEERGELLDEDDKAGVLERLRSLGYVE